MGETAESRGDRQVDLFFMLINAGILAYFGWSSNWGHRYTIDNPPQLIVMIAVLMWTVRIGAIVFGLAFILSLLKLPAGRLVNLVGGAAVSVIFGVVGIWDFMSPYFSGVPPILLIVLAVWNGYVTIVEIRALFARGALNPTAPH